MKQNQQAASKLFLHFCYRNAPVSAAHYTVRLWSKPVQYIQILFKIKKWKLMLLHCIYSLSQALGLFVLSWSCLKVAGRWTQADWPPADQGEERALKFPVDEHSEGLRNSTSNGIVLVISCGKDCLYKSYQRKQITVSRLKVRSFHDLYVSLYGYGLKYLSWFFSSLVNW